jgi:hypothetical protein
MVCLFQKAEVKSKEASGKKDNTNNEVGDWRGQLRLKPQPPIANNMRKIYEGEWKKDRQHYRGVYYYSDN